MSESVLNLIRAAGEALNMAQLELAKLKEQPKPLRLQVGKKYRSENGELVAIDDRWYLEGGHLFGVHMFYRSRTGIVFTESGHRVRWGENDRPIQLVEEVAECALS